MPSGGNRVSGASRFITFTAGLAWRHASPDCFIICTYSTLSGSWGTEAPREPSCAPSDLTNPRTVAL